MRVSRTQYPSHEQTRTATGVLGFEPTPYATTPDAQGSKLRLVCLEHQRGYDPLAHGLKARCEAHFIFGCWCMIVWWEGAVTIHSLSDGFYRPIAKATSFTFPLFFGAWTRQPVQDYTSRGRGNLFGESGRGRTDNLGLKRPPQLPIVLRIR